MSARSRTGCKQGTLILDAEVRRNLDGGKAAPFEAATGRQELEAHPGRSGRWRRPGAAVNLRRATRRCPRARRPGAAHPAHTPQGGVTFPDSILLKDDAMLAHFESHKRVRTQLMAMVAAP